MVFLVRGNTVQHLLVIPHLFQFLTLFWSQFVILDALVYHLRVMTLCLVSHKVTIIYCFVKGIFKVGLILQFQQSEGILVYLVTRCCCQTYQQRVEVLEDGSILSKYRSVGFIYDDQVKMPYAELYIIFIDVVNHRLVGGENESSLQVWLIIV